MTTTCEIAESFAEGTSSCPATDIIMIQASVGNGTSNAYTGLTPPIITGTGAAASQVVIEAYAVLLSTAHSVSTVSHTLVVTDMIESAAQANSTLIAALNQMAISVANATDDIAAMDVPQILLSAAQATSSVTANTVGTFLADSSGLASSSVSFGLLESITSTATGTSTVVLLRRVDMTLLSSADGSDDVFATTTPETFMLLGTANGTSMVLLQTERSILIESTAEASSDVWFRDPARVSWVLNTETTAISWYNNFAFESIAQPPGRVLAVGDDGLYELTGGTDSGEQIEAEVVSGFNDFGLSETKRVEAMYFGYTSEGRLSVTAETYESGHSPTTYFLEQRSADVPRNSRVVPGKGLYGRYWRMTIRNVDGADFEVHDATVDVAISSRRV